MDLDATLQEAIDLDLKLNQLRDKILLAISSVDLADLEGIVTATTTAQYAEDKGISIESILSKVSDLTDNAIGSWEWRKLENIVTYYSPSGEVVRQVSLIDTPDITEEKVL